MKRPRCCDCRKAFHPRDANSKRCRVCVELRKAKPVNHRKSLDTQLDEYFAAEVDPDYYVGLRFHSRSAIGDIA